MNSEVKDDLQINNILVTTFFADMTRFYQPLDLTVNGRAQRFIAIAGTFNIFLMS